MKLTKQGLILTTFLLTVVFFIGLMFLPESIIGHRDDNMLLFVPKILFLAITASLVSAFILIFIFRSEYIKAQVYTFNRFKYYLRLLVNGILLQNTAEAF